MPENPLVEAAKEALELQKPIEVTVKEPPSQEATAKLTEAEDEEEIFVAARTVQEMSVAQAKLIKWADNKMAKMNKDIEAAKVNLEIAKKRKWATEPFKKIVATATKKYEFYEKVKAALEAGYTIIPDMPMDVFAIRTTRKTPKENRRVENMQYNSGGPWVEDQKTNNPKLGEGKFVSNRPVVYEESWEGKDKDGKPTSMMARWAEEFDEHIDFPFKLARPAVLNDTAKALSEKFFDQLAVSPSTRGGGWTPHRQAKGDPMVIGRIFYRSGHHEKGVSFLVSWFIDSKDL